MCLDLIFFALEGTNHIFHSTILIYIINYVHLIKFDFSLRLIWGSNFELNYLESEEIQIQFILLQYTRNSFTINNCLKYLNQIYIFIWNLLSENWSRNWRTVDPSLDAREVHSHEHVSLNIIWRLCLETLIRLCTNKYIWTGVYIYISPPVYTP